jgi:hypothetical protein
MMYRNITSFMLRYLSPRKLSFLSNVAGWQREISMVAAYVCGP